MPSPAARPTDSLLRIFADVRLHLAEIGAPAEWVPEFLEVHIKGQPRPITILIPPAGGAPPGQAPPRFIPNEFQESILDALAGKALKTDALAAKVGDRRKLFRPGGLKDLVERGLVKHETGVGYYSTDDPPESLDGG